MTFEEFENKRIEYIKEKGRAPTHIVISSTDFFELETLLGVSPLSTPVSGSVICGVDLFIVDDEVEARFVTMVMRNEN